MKRIILICTVVFAALSMQSCTATFHASNRFPSHHGGHVVVHVEHHGPQHHKQNGKRYRKYRERHARYDHDQRLYGAHNGRQEPPRRPEPPRRRGH